MPPPIRQRLVRCAALVLALAVAACAAPPSGPPSDARTATDQKKEAELKQMEQMGQRNDDAPPK